MGHAAYTTFHPWLKPPKTVNWTPAQFFLKNKKKQPKHFFFFNVYFLFSCEGCIAHNTFETHNMSKHELDLTHFQFMATQLFK